MITSEQWQKIGVIGLLGGALLWMNSELQTTRDELHELRKTSSEEVREARKAHNEFVEMVITTYHIPLTK